MTELRTPLEIEALIAAQSGDIDWAMRAANELMATRTRVQELEARADPDPSQHPAVIRAVETQQSISYLMYNYPHFDDDLRAEITDAQTEFMTAHPEMTPMWAMQRAIDRVERRRGDPKTRADHETVEQMRAARAMGGRAANIELQATSGDDFDGDDGESSDEDGQRKLDNAEYFAKRRASQVPRNPTSPTFDWSQNE